MIILYKYFFQAIFYEFIFTHPVIYLKYIFHIYQQHKDWHSICSINLKKGEILIEELVQSLYSYLKDNPDATDTFCGIQLFWISSSKGTYSREELYAALNILVENQYLQRQINSDGTEIFISSLRQHLNE